MKKKVTYISTGLVLGNLWGGGSGSYKAREIKAPTKEKLIDLAIKGIADNSLDAGMGFENLIGAILNIAIITTIEIEGKEFVNKEYDTVVVGELTEPQADFLEECYYNGL